MWSVPALLLPLGEITARATLDVSGRVLQSDTRCVQPLNNRCFTTYVIQPLRSAHSFVYQAGPNDHSLQRELPVGTEISKQKWALVYRINGTIVDDFPITCYGVVAGVGLTLLLTGTVRAARGRMRRPGDEQRSVPGLPFGR